MWFTTLKSIQNCSLCVYLCVYIETTKKCICISRYCHLNKKFTSIYKKVSWSRYYCHSKIGVYFFTPLIHTAPMETFYTYSHSLYLNGNQRLWVIFYFPTQCGENGVTKSTNTSVMVHTSIHSVGFQMFVCCSSRFIKSWAHKLILVNFGRESVLFFFVS